MVLRPCPYTTAMSITTLNSMRADDTFAVFCKDLTTLADNTLVAAPMLPRGGVYRQEGDAPVPFLFDNKS